MSFFSRFGLARAPAPGSVPQSQLGSGHSQSAGPAGSQSRSRRELLRVVLRDTMNRHGVPAGWLEAEVLVSTSRAGERGIHWRLVVKHWDPRLLTHALALQQALLKRLTTFDPLASNWLTGVSWQFDSLEDTPNAPLPNAASWTEAASAPAPAVLETEPVGGSGDVISGPPLVERAPSLAAAQNSADAKSDLEHLFAVRDADFRRHADSDPAGGDATQPMFLRTEPAKL